MDKMAKQSLPPLFLVLECCSPRSDSRIRGGEPGALYRARGPPLQKTESTSYTWDLPACSDRCSFGRDPMPPGQPALRPLAPACPEFKSRRERFRRVEREAKPHLS